jgi:hypothetical protein
VARSLRIADAVLIEGHGIWPFRESAFVSVDQRLSWVLGCSVGRAVSAGRLRHGILLLLLGCPVVQSMHGCPSASLAVGGAAGPM